METESRNTFYFFRSETATNITTRFCNFYHFGPVTQENIVRDTYCNRRVIVWCGSLHWTPVQLHLLGRGRSHLSSPLHWIYQYKLLQKYGISRVALNTFLAPALPAKEWRTSIERPRFLRLIIVFFNIRPAVGFQQRGGVRVRWLRVTKAAAWSRSFQCRVGARIRLLRVYVNLGELRALRHVLYRCLAGAADLWVRSTFKGTFGFCFAARGLSTPVFCEEFRETSFFCLCQSFERIPKSRHIPMRASSAY